MLCFYSAPLVLIGKTQENRTLRLRLEGFIMLLLLESLIFWLENFLIKNISVFMFHFLKQVLANPPYFSV